MVRKVIRVDQINSEKCIVVYEDGEVECGIAHGRSVSNRFSVSFIIKDYGGAYVEQMGADRCVIRDGDRELEVDLDTGRRIAEERGYPFFAITTKSERREGKFQIHINIGSKEEPKFKKPEVPEEPKSAKPKTEDYVLVERVSGKCYIIKDGKRKSAPKSYALEYAEKYGLKVLDETGECIGETKAEVAEPESVPETSPGEPGSVSPPADGKPIDEGPSDIPAASEKDPEPVPERPKPAPRGTPRSTELAPPPVYIEREQVPPFIVLDLPLAGEDAPPVAAADGNAGRLIVCDGMGGSGNQPIYLNGEVRTMAFAASRCVMAVADSFIHDNHGRFMSDEIGEACRELGELMASSLTDCANENGMVYTARGTLPRFLPTTFASAVYLDEDDAESVSVSVIWAGDSRVYCVLPDSGLHPLSKDDSKGEADDQATIFQDAGMLNTVSIDSPFHLNYRRFTIPKPCMLFASSDGVCQYAGTPMHLEQVFITKGERSIADSMLDFLKCHSQDDRTFAAALVGCSEKEFIESINSRASLIDDLVAKADAISAPFDSI
jgi:hypothetical protein